MSCFIVSDFHINALVAWADANGADLDVSPDALAHELASANRAAFAERYEGRYQDEVAPFDGFDRSVDLVDLAPVAIVKACDCLAYQCSDWAAWDQSGVALDLGEIRSVAVQLARGPWSPGLPDDFYDVRNLAGYGAAAWELHEPERIAERVRIAERDRRLATLDYPEHELAAILAAFRATRGAA
jgi:hypothetical protein